MPGYYANSKSNNAILAERQNKYPAYRAARLLKVPTKAIYHVLCPCEWHHTSICYNKTNYYYIGILLKLQQGLSVAELCELGYDEGDIIDNYYRLNLLQNYMKTELKNED